METTDNSMSLEQYLDNADGLEIGEEIEIVSGDDILASKMLRRLGAIEKQIAANSAMASAERQRITDWEVSVNETLQNSALYLRSVLEQYAIHERQENNRKTINLPFGVLRTTPTNPKWKIENADRFMAWAKQSGAENLIRVKEEPALAEIKASLSVDSNGNAVDDFGIEVPGIDVEMPERPFNATVKPSL